MAKLRQRELGLCQTRILLHDRTHQGEEIYLRYRSFHSQADFAQNLAKTNPIKIDIGAVFEASPSDSHAVQSKKNLPVQRELVFDVDMDEYDQVRYCGCKGANICPKCWEYMKMAMVVMDDALRHDFGFQHIQWFFSGRRGVHAWVCDESARFLTDEGRSAVANYFMVRSLHMYVCVSFTAPTHRRAFSRIFSSCNIGGFGK